MDEAENDKSSVGQGAPSADSAEHVMPEWHDLLSKDWQKMLEEELTFVDENRPLKFELTKKEIADKVKFLKQWQPGPTKDELEGKYSQSEIDKELAKVNEWQKQLDEAKASRTEELKEAKDKLSKLEEELKAQANAVQESLAYQKEKLGQKGKLKKEIEELKKEWDEAKGTEWEKLKKKDWKDAKKKLKSLEGTEFTDLLDGAIRADFDALQKAFKDVLESATHRYTSKEDLEKSKEELEKEIERIDKLTEYLKQNSNALVQEALQPKSASQGATQD